MSPARTGPDRGGTNAIDWFTNARRQVADGPSAKPGTVHGGFYRNALWDRLREFLADEQSGAL